MQVIYSQRAHTFFHINENGQICYWHTLYYIWSNYAQENLMLCYLSSYWNIYVQVHILAKFKRKKISISNTEILPKLLHCFEILLTIYITRVPKLHHWLLLAHLNYNIFFLSLMDYLETSAKSKKMSSCLNLKKMYKLCYFICEHNACGAFLFFVHI